MKNKKAFEMNFIGWLILGLIVLVIFLISLGIANGKGTAAIAFVKNLFSFGAA